MIPSIWLDYYAILPPEEAVLSVREGGFACGELGVDQSLALLARGNDPEKIGIAFRRFLDDSGFSVPQGHLDFQQDLCLPETVDALKKQLTLFQAIGIPNAVIHLHGGLDLPEEKRLDVQESHMRKLLDFIAGTNTTLCLENLRPNPSVADADRILAWIHRLGGKNLGICLDTGHLHVARVSLKTTTQTHGAFIRTAGSYLKALHINGNDGTDDYHLAPFSIKNNIDWAEVVTTLRETGFAGPFNLEVPGEVRGKPPMYIRKRKLCYLKELVDYMLSDQFPTQ